MKKRIKNAGEFRRFYASGIPMQREQKNLFSVAAGTMVNIVLVKTHTAICEVKCNKEQKAALGKESVVVSIPLDNFMGDRIVKAKAEKVAKKSTKKPKKSVTQENDLQATAEVQPENATDLAVETNVDTAPVNPEAVPVAVETPVEAPIVNTEPATETAPTIEQPAEMAVV